MYHDTAFANESMDGRSKTTEAHAREEPPKKTGDQDRGSSNNIQQTEARKSAPPNIQVEARSAVTIKQGSFNARKSDDAARRQLTKSMDARAPDKEQVQKNAGPDTPSSSIWKLLTCSQAGCVSRSALRNCLGVFSSQKSNRTSVGKSMPKMKKSRPRPILITPKRRFERERQGGSLKKKRNRVHFFMPRSRSIFSLHIVEPSNTAIRRWLAFMLLPLVYESWTFPYRLALAEPSLSSGLFVVDVIVDFLMIVSDMHVFVLTRGLNNLLCVCVCVCIYIYIYIYIYTHAYIYMHTHIHTYTLTYMHA
jgi:hypothetical protein